MRVQDSIGLYRVEDIAINVAQVNEAPIDIVLRNTSGSIVSSLSIAENIPGTVPLGTVQGMDPENSTLTYRVFDNSADLSANIPSSRFAINSLGELSSLVAFNYEATQNASFIVEVKDGVNIPYLETFTLMIVNGNDAPILSLPGSVNVSEEVSAVTLFDANAIDEDSGFISDNGITYSLQNNHAGRFSINSATGVVSTTRSFDLEGGDASNYLLQVNYSDGVATKNNTITVNVTGVNEGPDTITVLPGSGVSYDATTRTITISETQSAAANFGRFVGNDPEGSSLIYTASNYDTNLFSFVQSGDGFMYVKNTVNGLGGKGPRTLRMTVQDPSSNDAAITQDYTIVIQDVLKNPTDLYWNSFNTSNANVLNGSIRVGIPAGTLIGQLGVSDPDGGNYSYMVTTSSTQVTVDSSGKIYAGSNMTLTPGTRFSFGTVVTDNSAKSQHDAGQYYETMYFDVLPSLNNAPIANATRSISVAEHYSGNTEVNPSSVKNGSIIGNLANIGGGALFSDDTTSATSLKYGFASNSANQNIFSILENGDVRVDNAAALNWESGVYTYNLSVVAKDLQGAISNVGTLKVNVNDVSEWVGLVPAWGSPIGIYGHNTRITGTYATETYYTTRDSGGRDVLSYTWYQAGGGSAGVFYGFKILTSARSAYYRSTPGGFLFDLDAQSLPVVLDLNGDGFNWLTDVHFDMDNDGIVDRTPWLAAGDAYLALDRNNDGIIGSASEISFVNDVIGAKTDMEGLHAYDTNSDGILDANDEVFEDFLVWNDENSDGISQTAELLAFNEVGIASINLELTPSEVEVAAPDVLIHNTAVFNWLDGTQGTIGDVSFMFDQLANENSEETEDANTDLNNISTEDQLLANFIQAINAFDVRDGSDLNSNLVNAENYRDMFAVSVS